MPTTQVTLQAEAFTAFSLTSMDTLEGTIDVTSFFGNTYDVGQYLGSLKAILGNDCIIPDDAAIDTTTPPDSDPPFPPVWPYPTGLTYSREHFDMNLRAIRGDTNKWDFQVLISGAAVNISAMTFRFTAKWQLDDADVDAVFTCTNSDGISLTDPTNGELRVTVVPSKTTPLPSHDTDLYYDLQYVDGAGEVHTVSMGVLTIRCDRSITVP